MRRLPPQTKKKIKRELAGLGDAPDPPNRLDQVKRLDAPDQGEPVYRLRVGDHRAVVGVVRLKKIKNTLFFIKIYIFSNFLD
jgi:mRNA-degrading endonuclease RelE of RelBE toxin-antitoxin system